ncbi:hypothetical protein, partial [Escherichia coli]|uniref:hypothetical protein n=3 Tax=Enterobacteriaceae TaxID=543 RepID=UPI0019D66A2C
PGQPVSGGPNDTSVGEISVKTGNNARNGGKNSLNRLIRCVCGKKIGPDPRNFNQRVSLGRNDLLIRTFLSIVLILGFKFCMSSLGVINSAINLRAKALPILISLIPGITSLGTSKGSLNRTGELHLRLHESRTIFAVFNDIYL